MTNKAVSVIPKKQLMNDKILQSLRVMIAERRFKPGQRLNVEELARELGVSRTPVWEAIRRLGQDGIVRNEPNRGVFMVDNPLESIKDRLQVRNTLDRLACKLACERIDKHFADRLAKCLPRLLHAIETSDIRHYFNADTDFHRIICEASGNLVLSNLYESITTHIFPTTFNVVTSLPNVFIFHQEIVAGFYDNNPQRVDEAISHHGDLLLAQLQEQIQTEALHKEIIKRIKQHPNTLPSKGKKRS